MATAPTQRLVPVEEYLRSTYNPDLEYLDGVVVARSMPATAHSLLALIVAASLFSVRRELGFAVLPECRTEIVRGSRYRIPDLLICGLPVPAGKVLDTVPWLVIEVLSPEDKLSEAAHTIQGICRDRGAAHCAARSGKARSAPI